MFKNYIKETIALNKIELESIEGKRLFYNKFKNSISLFFMLTILVAFISMIILNEDNNPGTLIWILMTLVGIYEILKTISRIVLKNPVFILNGDQLYYIKTKQWYDISEHKFEEEFIGRINYSFTYCMYNKAGKRIFAENNWYLMESGDFKKTLRYRRVMKIKKRREQIKGAT